MRCAEMHSILKNKHEELSAYVEAANVYKQCDTTGTRMGQVGATHTEDAAAVNAFMRAAEMSMDMNRISQAAKQFKEIGELHEKEFQWRKAVDALKQVCWMSPTTDTMNCEACMTVLGC